MKLLYSNIDDSHGVSPAPPPSSEPNSKSVIIIVLILKLLTMLNKTSRILYLSDKIELDNSRGLLFHWLRYCPPV